MMMLDPAVERVLGGNVVGHDIVAPDPGRGCARRASTSAYAISLDFIDRFTGGRLGRHDLPCPICGPWRRSRANQQRTVLRMWRLQPHFATYHCARCGEKGYTRDRSAPAPDLMALTRAHAEVAARERFAVEQQLAKARWLWSRRRPIAGSVAETYLREARRYGGPLPATLGYLAPRGKHGPAMVAAFGLACETEAGALAIADDAVRGVHITRLTPDGAEKAGTDADKIMIGRSLGSPIVLAPVNDLLGLVVSEGVEDALSAHEATGLGAWAAGSASRLSAVANVVPHYVECIAVLADGDADGRRHAGALLRRLQGRRFDVRTVTFDARSNVA
jgi:Toprim domain